jgi:Skp family chaperone for outer membrane proteins
MKKLAPVLSLCALAAVLLTSASALAAGEADLQARMARQDAIIAELQGEIARLDSRLATLQGRIGIFDPTQVFATCEPGRQLEGELNRFRVGREAEIGALTDAFQRELQAFQKGESALSEEARAQRAEALTLKERDLRRRVADSDEDLNQLRSQGYKKIADIVRSALQDYGRQNGYRFILRTDSIDYSRGGDDVSAEIVKLVDARSKTASR